MAFSRYEANITNEDYDCYMYIDGQWVQVEPYIYDNSAQSAVAGTAVAGTSAT